MLPWSGCAAPPVLRCRGFVGKVQVASTAVKGSDALKLFFSIYRGVTINKLSMLLYKCASLLRTWGCVRVQDWPHCESPHTCQNFFRKGFWGLFLSFLFSHIRLHPKWIRWEQHRRSCRNFWHVMTASYMWHQSAIFLTCLGYDVGCQDGSKSKTSKPGYTIQKTHSKSSRIKWEDVWRSVEAKVELLGHVALGQFFLSWNGFEQFQILVNMGVTK